MADNATRLDRRNILKAIGSTAVVGIGLSATAGNVAAIEEKRRLTQAYSDERRLRIAFEQHGEGLRQTLVKEGFVAEDFAFGNVAFDLRGDVTGVEPSETDGLAGVTAIRKEGQLTAFGMATTSSVTHDITLFVQPERDDAYALVEPKSTDERFIVTSDDVSTQSCTVTSCTTDCCELDTAYEETIECSDDDCRSGCKVVSTDCICDECECSRTGC